MKGCTEWDSVNATAKWVAGGQSSFSTDPAALIRLRYGIPSPYPESVYRIPSPYTVSVCCHLDPKSRYSDRISNKSRDDENRARGHRCGVERAAVRPAVRRCDERVEMAGRGVHG